MSNRATDVTLQLKHLEYCIQLGASLAYSNLTHRYVERHWMAQTDSQVS
jgi:hypothetical protein